MAEITNSNEHSLSSSRIMTVAVDASPITPSDTLTISTVNISSWSSSMSSSMTVVSAGSSASVVPGSNSKTVVSNSSTSSPTNEREGYNNMCSANNGHIGRDHLSHHRAAVLKTYCHYVGWCMEECYSHRDVLYFTTDRMKSTEVQNPRRFLAACRYSACANTIRMCVIFIRGVHGV